MNEILQNPAVIWFLVGLVFLLAEFVLPGLIVLFFGIGCWVTSLVLLGFPDISFNAQLGIFLISSILSLALLRRSLKNWIAGRGKAGNVDETEFFEKQCIAESDIDPDNGGKVSFKGAQWDADSSLLIKKGETVVIKKINGIRLIVEPLNPKN